MRRCLLLVLLASFFGQHQCQLDENQRTVREKSFFVSRSDTKEAICVESYDAYWQLPTFKLDELEIPEGVGIVDWSWRSGWQWDKERLLFHGGNVEKFIAGDHPFQLLEHWKGGWLNKNTYVLASNISLWLTGGNSAESNGFLFELDHWNETTRVKDTTMKYCERMPEGSSAECIIVDYKNGTNLLNDGNDWMGFEIITLFDEISTPTDISILGILASIEFKSLGGNMIYSPIAQWNSTIKLPRNVVFGEFVQIFGKSHKRNAAYSGSEDGIADVNGFLSNAEMKRNYTHRNKGKLCIEIEGVSPGNRNGSSQEVIVKNLITGRVEPVTKMQEFDLKNDLRWSKIKFDQLDAGKYEITFRFSNSGPPEKIDMCSGASGNIWKTWRQFPKTIAKCQFKDRGWGDEFSAGPSSTMIPDLKPNWRLDGWMNVCDRLGIGSNDTQVEIKFCNFFGCNFSQCPHLQDDPP